MEYQALYRKWRPINFSDVIGQSHIVDTLKNEIVSERIAHAYLFCGTRGTGKTTTAKILSRAVNCLKLTDTGEPCNECDSCVGILSGAIMDVSEIDAASNNGVDNIRSIRNEIIYAPANVKYRVYIIDEVHMLSTAAFNALLKTLEEPPPHVIFILATTEAAKIPATVQSRCQRFDFTRITVGDISHRLALIAEKDGINITHDALRKISAIADGSMRDALSILDRCTTYDEITLETVEQLVGIAGKEKLCQLTACIQNGQAGDALILVDELLRAGKDVGGLFDSLLNHFRELLICKSMDEPDKVLSFTDEQTAVMKKQAEGILYETIIYAVKQISDTIALAKWADNQRVLLEACIVKLCKPELAEGTDALLARIANLEQNRPTVQYVEAPVRKQEQEHPVSMNDVPFDVDEASVFEETNSTETPVSQETQPVKAKTTPTASAASLVEKIKNAHPGIRPNLLQCMAVFESDTLVIIQKRKTTFEHLIKPENLNTMAETAGCKVRVSNGETPPVTAESIADIKPQETVVLEEPKSGIEALIAQKELFGDKMIIE